MSGVSLARSLWLLPTISSLFYFYPSTRSPENFPPSEVSEIRQNYDFIIVGGGTAGCVLANRLSEDSGSTVLLIEAGPQEPHEVQIPSIAPYLQLTELDWQYAAEPSTTSCLSMKDNRCLLPRGKVLGGSSSINFMLYVRGNKKDYDLWEKFGNPDWDFDSILPYFKKSESNSNPNLDPYYHSSVGYQKVSEAVWTTSLQDMFKEAAIELDYPVLDINGPQQTGFAIPQGYYHKGSRYSSSKAFLKPINTRPNLDILLNALVSKINFDQNNRAVGINFLHNDKNVTVSVTKEVILSSGAFGSPQLLMLSGIGPSKHLKQFGINHRVDLPVGQNLQDHVASVLPFSIGKAVSLKRKRLESFGSIYQYAMWGSGPLTTFGGVEGIGFANTKYMNISLDWPDIEFHYASASIASDSGQYLRHTLNVRDEVWDEYLSPLSKSDSVSIIVKLMRPNSRGYIELKSTDPNIKPMIVTNYLNDSIDVLTLIEGMKLAKRFGETKSFRRFGGKMFMQPILGCENLSFGSDQYWECFVRHLTLTIYHYSGTAKMGPFWDPEAVVDPQLRVYGTSGLRVADASIFPTIPTGNTNAAVLMVAEKASDMIKSYWKEFPEKSINVPIALESIPKINPDLWNEKKETVLNYVLNRDKRTVEKEQQQQEEKEVQIDGVFKFSPSELLKSLASKSRNQISSSFGSLWKQFYSNKNYSVPSTKLSNTSTVLNEPINETSSANSLKNIVDSSSGSHFVPSYLTSAMKNLLRFSGSDSDSNTTLTVNDQKQQSLNQPVDSTESKSEIDDKNVTLLNARNDL